MSKYSHSCTDQWCFYPEQPAVSFDPSEPEPLRVGSGTFASPFEHFEPGPDSTAAFSPPPFSVSPIPAYERVPFADFVDLPFVAPFSVSRAQVGGGALVPVLFDAALAELVQGVIVGEAAFTR